jgi:hypothetical protein
VISASGGREREFPAAFSNEPLATSLARAKVEGRLERASMLGDTKPADVAASERQLILEGLPEEARAMRRLSRGLHGDVNVLHRSLVAAGRESDAAAVKKAALRFEDSAAMRAAVRATS